jgi:3(or 17)beta-hydroxysteroid dehydrogenase
VKRADSEKEFAGRVALVTGAAGVIGRAICGAFTRAGATVVAADLAEHALQKLGDELGVNCTTVRLDVANPADWESARRVLLDRFGGLDVLVNNAGYLKPADIEQASLEDWHATMRVNADGTFLGCKLGVQLMKGRGGAIVNLSSAMGLHGVATHPAYCASKAAVRLLTRSVAQHCGQRGYPIRVNAVLPGAIDSEMVRRNVPVGMPEERYLDAVRARHPIGRLGRPDEIAEAVLFAASERASFMTGADLVVDGGSSS